MKSFGMYRLSLLLGFGAAALFLSPAAKAQEVSSDHFTETGVQNVYETAPVKAATPKPKRTVETQARSRNNSPAVLEASARTPLLAAQGGSKTASSKRKSAQAGPKKQ